MNRWVVFAFAACAVTAGCDDNDTTSPSSQPAVFSTILRPANEVPPITNAEANGIGAAQITLQVTRSAGGAISAATADFKRAMRDLAAGKPQSAIQFSRSNPPVKALRVAMKLIEEFPDVPFESVQIEGRSGCSDFAGSALALPGSIRIDFAWNCQWRAEQLGWKDPFGDPDQIRAAREFGYQCFERFERR